jgi:ankyrin repeat protein
VLTSVITGNYKAVVLLLNANANPNLVTRYIVFILFLIDLCFINDYDLTRDVHETCLHYAVRSKSPQIISKLVEAGAGLV